MKRIETVGLALVAVYMLGGITAPSSLGACDRAAEPHTGNYNNQECKLPREVNASFIEVRAGSLVAIGGGIFCAETEEVNTGNYQAGCTTKEVTGKYVRIRQAGPVWYHRPINTGGEGAEIEPTAPENLSGSGGEQTLRGEIGSTEVEIAAKSVQIKGAIFDDAGRGQVKLELAYAQPKLTKPELKGCNVLIGEKNTVQAKGNLMWKWNGEAKQLEEEAQTNQTPELVFSAIEPPVQKPTPKEPTNLTNTATFTTITLSGTGCGILASKSGVVGSEVGIPNLLRGEWGRALAVRTMASEG